MYTSSSSSSSILHCWKIAEEKDFRKPTAGTVVFWSPVRDCHLHDYSQADKQQAFNKFVKKPKITKLLQTDRKHEGFKTQSSHSQPVPTSPGHSEEENTFSSLKLQVRNLSLTQNMYFYIILTRMLCNSLILRNGRGI